MDESTKVADTIGLPEEQLLRLLFKVSAAQLLERIASGDASAADIGVAVKMLKDNNITADVKDNRELDALKERLAARKQGNVTGRAQRDTMAGIIPVSMADREDAINQAIDQFKVN